MSNKIKNNIQISNENIKTLLSKNLESIKLSLQLGSVIKLILFFIFFTYIIKLEMENCHCSKGWEREFIKYYSLAVIIFCIIVIFFPIQYLRMRMVHSLLVIFGIFFIFSVAKYIYDLKKENCQCSSSWKRSALNIYAWLSIIMLIVMFVGTFFASYRYQKHLFK